MENNDVKIAGSGTISSGEYNVVSIDGSGTINGDIKCETLKIAGSAKCLGVVETNDTSIAGSCKFEKDIKANNLKLAGAIKVNGNISCEKLKSSGAINVLGECNVGTLIHEGDDSKFNNIYGDNINIKAKHKKNIHINEIEATTIELKSVVAKRISGDDVVVSGKCIIDTIEFKNSLKISKSVKVVEIIKL